MRAHKELEDALAQLRNLITESSFGEAAAQQLSGRIPEQDVAETVRQADEAVPSPALGADDLPKQGFWAKLTETERTALIASAEDVVYPVGTVLWFEGQPADHALVIQSGSVRVSVNRHGHERIIAFRRPGDIVGERAALLLRRRSATIVAMDTVRGLRMTTQQFATYLSDHPRVVAVMESELYDRFVEPTNRPVAYGAPPGPHTEVSLYTPSPGYNYRPTHRPAPSYPSERSSVEPTELNPVSSPAPPIGRDLDSQPSAQMWQGRSCTIVYTDIAGFSASHRNDRDRLDMRRAMYTLLREAFAESAVPWHSCHIEDRGDGALIVVPPEIPTAAVIDPMIASLAMRLRRHNQRSTLAVRIQLRIAVHVGPVLPDPPGVSGWAVIRTARLLDARPLKERLAATGADLGFITSGFVYESVIAHSPGYVNPAEYEPISCRVKKLKLEGWIRLHGATSPGSHRLHADDSRQTEQKPR